LRHREAQIALWATRFFIAGSTMATLVVGGIAIGYDAEAYRALAVLGIGNAIVYMIALVSTFYGFGKQAGLVVLVMSVLTILVICSVLSAGTSIESVLFGLAIMPFVLLRSNEGTLRLSLTLSTLAVYLACEMLWPAGQGSNELPASIAENLAMFNRALAALLAAAALVVLQVKLRLNRQILEGAARYGELRATTDELTGVYNRRPVIAQLEEYAERGRGNYAIALIDLDDFKAINDAHGHDCGDEIIRLVADALTEHFRASDMVSRWGGDEFLVLMPGIRHADLEPVLERLRAEIAGIRQPCGGEVHTVTVSIGAAMGELGQSPDECIAAADHALYRAKEGGRNKVVTIGTSAPTGALGRF
jgi:diguanylate cyclase (GGDEF)-like protein